MRARARAALRVGSPPSLGVSAQPRAIHSPALASHGFLPGQPHKVLSAIAHGVAFPCCSARSLHTPNKPPLFRPTCSCASGRGMGGACVPAERLEAKAEGRKWRKKLAARTPRGQPVMRHQVPSARPRGKHLLLSPVPLGPRWCWRVSQRPLVLVLESSAPFPALLAVSRRARDGMRISAYPLIAFDVLPVLPNQHRQIEYMLKKLQAPRGTRQERFLDLSG